MIWRVEFFRHRKNFLSDYFPVFTSIYSFLLAAIIENHLLSCRVSRETPSCLMQRFSHINIANPITTLFIKNDTQERNVNA
jgi:hypothetical protein